MEPIVDVKAEQEEISVTFLDVSGSTCQAPVSTGDPIVKLQDEDDIKPYSNASAMSGPRKKRRLVVGVVVSTLERLKLDKKNVEDEVKKLFKPKGKKSIAHMTVSDEVIQSRLEPIGIEPFKINLPRAEVNMMVTRKFMSAVYGGSSEGTFPPIGKEKLAEHGMNDFMYLHLDYQPCAPQIPGKCGLWFSTGSRRGDWGGVYRVITRDLLRSEWQYMGQYEIKPAKSLTREEWVSQKDKVKNTWAAKICCKKWGRFVRARIEFRKSTGFDRAPTDEEVDFILQSGLWQNTTPEDVKAAFNSGEERLRVWTLKCIGYDYGFQLDLCAKFPLWIPPPPKRLQNAKPNNKRQPKKVVQKGEANLAITTASSASVGSKGKKRKRSFTPESGESPYDPEIDEDVMFDEDPEEEVINNIRTRGTKSRPILL